MAIADTLNGTIVAKIVSKLSRAGGNTTGKDTLSHNKDQVLTDGSSTNQASGQFGTTFTATTGGITISLADSADPLGAAGDDVPSSDPEGLKLRALMIENKDAINFIEVKQGANGEVSMLTGSTDSIKISAGGVLLWTTPAGINAMNDGVDDELLITADSASVSTKITYIYG